MTRSPRALHAVLASIACAINVGCSNGTGAVITPELTPPSKPAEAARPDVSSRPLAVAWTSARGKRCGFAFDPAKLRTSYLAYETKQGATGEAYAKIEKAYDTSYRLTLEKASSDPNYCTEEKQRHIKVDLERHIVGDFTPNLPPSKVAVACKSWFGCPSDTNESFDSNQFWRDKDRELNPR